MTIDRKVKKTATIFIRHTGIKTDGTSLRKTVCTACGRNDTDSCIFQPAVCYTIPEWRKVEELSADKVFVFTVALKDGFNIITAQAGEVQDTMTLEKVEKEPEIYVLPEVNERAEGVANWFQTVGDMDLKAPMEFPEGRYSIKDTMEELAKIRKQWKLLQKQ